MFGKDKESKEFFEVFKKPGKQEGASYSIKEFQRKQENPTVIISTPPMNGPIILVPVMVRVLEA